MCFELCSHNYESCHFGVIPVRSCFGTGRFSPISEESHVCPVGAGHFGPFFGVSRLGLIYFDKAGKSQVFDSVL